MPAGREAETAGAEHSQNNVALATHDRVICKNTQYTSTSRALKFQHKHGDRQEFIVRSTNGGLVEIEEFATGIPSTRQEASLKLLPRVYEVADATCHFEVDQDLPKDGAKLMCEASVAQARPRRRPSSEN